ncbi:MAG: choice-of-anchor K domain-containing protein [Cyanobacteria bacterium P01_A01_bin.105]
MKAYKYLLPAIGVTAAFATGGLISSANAFTIGGTSAQFDDVLLKNGNLVTSDSVYDKVEFLDDVNGTGENQVRWGSAVYGTEVTTEKEVTEWVDQGHWAEEGYWDWVNGRQDYGYWYKQGRRWRWKDIEWVDTSYEKTYTQQVTETVYTYENKSGLGFAGVEALDISVGENFQIGTLKHFNETIWGDNLAGIKSGFELLLDLGDEVGQTAFNFDLHIDETNNSAAAHENGVCPYETEPGKGCSDQITWEFALEETQTFTKDGDEYTLELVGFSPEAMDAANITNSFISQEDGTSEASLWAKIVKIEPPQESVPEPTGLVGLGLLGAYVVKSRRRGQQQAELASA